MRIKNVHYYYYYYYDDDDDDDDDDYDDNVNGSDSGFPFLLTLYRVDMDLERSHYLLKFE